MNVNLKRKINNSVEANVALLESATSKNKTKKSINIYVGTKKYLLTKSGDSDANDKFHDYIAHCFNSIYSMLTPSRPQMHVDNDKYEIILQFLYAIAEYNNKLNFIPRGKNTPIFADKTYRNYGIKYKVLKSPNVMRSECMWLDENNVVIFHECLVNQVLNYDTNGLDITVEKSLQDVKTSIPEYWQHARDIIVVPEETTTKLAALFSIAEHAAIHIFDNKDYIQHENWNKQTIFTTHSCVRITPIGSLANLEKLTNCETNNILFNI